jgi:hypothetical protein
MSPISFKASVDRLVTMYENSPTYGTSGSRYMLEPLMQVQMR